MRVGKDRLQSRSVYYSVFSREYDAPIRDKTCPAGVCSNLSVYSIDPEACIGCGRCAKVCPSNAASGVLKQPFTINKTVCISAVLADACPTGAIHTQRGIKME